MSRNVSRTGLTNAGTRRGDATFVLRICFGFLISCFVFFDAYGYGPSTVNTDTHAAIVWETPITYHVESDLTVRGVDMSVFLTSAIANWTAVPYADLAMSSASLRTPVMSGGAYDTCGSSPSGDIVSDVTYNNVCDYLHDDTVCPTGPTEDCQNPILIDASGAVVSRFFGTGNRFGVLGFAGIVSYNLTTNKAVKGQGVFNAACLEGIESDGCETAGTGDTALSISYDDMEAIMTHELGHFLGLNHTQTNLAAAFDNETDDADDNDQYIDTMFAFFRQGTGEYIKTPAFDDQTGIASLYPSSDFSASTWAVEGVVYDTDRTTEYQCANIVLRGADDPNANAVSYVSGEMYAGGAAAGDFYIEGLTPGINYTIELEPIYEQSTGASGIKPCDAQGGNPGPTDFEAVEFSETISCQTGEVLTGVFISIDGRMSISGNCTGTSPVDDGGGGGGCSLIP